MSGRREWASWLGKATYRTLLLLGTSAVTFAGGRPDDSTRNWFGDFAGGWAFPESDAGNVLDDDWMLSGGATYWPADRNIGINFNLGWSELDLTSGAIQAINELIEQDPQNDGRVDDGEVEIWQIGVNGIWSLGERTDQGLYLTGGVTATHLEGSITQTGLVYYPPFCDPWYWWWCYPGGVGTGSILVGSRSTTEYGYNLGLGYSFPTGSGQLFAETKYTFISTDSEDLVYVPVIVGYRW